jgi:hypothetical protein
VVAAPVAGMLVAGLFPLAITRASADGCNAPALICKASANQDRSLYVRDHSRYEQKIHVERFKGADANAKQEEIRETTAMVEPDKKPDKTGRVPVVVRVIADTDKRGAPKGKVDENEMSFLSFGSVIDLAFFPLLPENLRYYDFQEMVAERKSEKWYRFAPKAGITEFPLASGIAELDQETGEVLTIKIEALHNLDKLDKEARKLKSFYATIDYSQFEGALRMPTLASGGGVSEIPKFQGVFKFSFQEAKYVLVDKVD